jgi:opacity protein-like surface antigen
MKNEQQQRRPFMERWGIPVWIATATLLATGVACAQDTNVYLSAGLGQMRQSFDTHEYVLNVPAQGLSRDDTTDRAWDLGAGYQINEFLATELSYLDAGTGERQISDSSSAHIKSHVTGLLASLVPQWSFSSGSYFYARIGALYADDKVTYKYPEASNFNRSDSIRGTTWFAGMGVAYQVLDRWSIGLEYVRSGGLRQDSSIADNYVSGARLGFNFDF